MRPIDADFLTDCFKSSLDTDETLFNEVMKKIIGVLEATPSIKTKEIKYYDDDEQVWKIGEVIVNSSEKPNNSKVSEIPTGSERSSE